MDIPCTPAHFVEPDRLETVLRHRPPDHGVEPDIGQFLTVIDPGLSAVLGVHDFGRPVGELSWEAPGERVRGFDDVIVGRDHGVAASGSGRVGQKRDRAILARLRGGEVKVVGQLVDRFHPLASLRGCMIECAVTAFMVDALT
jgi:hypothetical protein